MKQVDVINPLRGCFSWFFEQQLYDIRGVSRAVKSSEGSGNIPKVIVNYETD